MKSDKLKIWIISKKIWVDTFEYSTSLKSNTQHAKFQETRFLNWSHTPSANFQLLHENGCARKKGYHTIARDIVICTCYLTVKPRLTLVTTETTQENVRRRLWTIRLLLLILIRWSVSSISFLFLSPEKKSSKKNCLLID